MEPDYKALSFWWMVGQTLFVSALALYTWISNRQKANSSAIERLRDDLTSDLNELDDRVIRVETNILHLPTHEDVGRLHTRINETNESLKHIDGKLTQIDHTTKMINEYLLDRGK